MSLGESLISLKAWDHQTHISNLIWLQNCSIKWIVRYLIVITLKHFNKLFVSRPIALFFSSKYIIWAPHLKVLGTFLWYLGVLRNTWWRIQLFWDIQDWRKKEVSLIGNICHQYGRSVINWCLASFVDVYSSTQCTFSPIFYILE